MDKPVIGIPELQSHSVSDALALVDSVEKKVDSCHQKIQVYVAARSFTACSNSKGTFYIFYSTIIFIRHI